MPRYYGAQIRGGGSAIQLSLDAERLSLPKDDLDIMICFDWEKYLEFDQELLLRVDTLVFYENDSPRGINLPERSFQLGFSRKSQEVTGSALNKNIVALGLMKRIFALSRDRVKEAIDEDEELNLLKENL